MEMVAVLPKVAEFLRRKHGHFIDGAPSQLICLDYPQPVSTADLANDCAVIQVAIPMLDHVFK